MLLIFPTLKEAGPLSCLISLLPSRGFHTEMFCSVSVDNTEGRGPPSLLPRESFSVQLKHL